MSKNQKISFSFLLLLLLQLSCSTSKTPPQRIPSGENTAVDYPAIFKKSRELLAIKPPLRPVVDLRKTPESDVVEYLKENPQALEFDAETIGAEIKAKQSGVPVDPTKHVRLIPPAGKSGYSDLKIYINHPYYSGNYLAKPSNLIDVWKGFILRAKKQIILNVFDFDLEDVAEVLIKQAKKGLDVRVGIDQKSVIDVRPEVKKVADMLIAGGVKVTGVNPVGLNHQKITAIDWGDTDRAAVLFSSGNLTKSCMDPEGDLRGTRPLPKESVPNANHLITLKSWLLANLVHHELSKTLDEEYLLRGSQYPLNGAYQVTGPGVDPATLEAYPEPSITITFSPGGGMKNINRNLIAHLLKRETGGIRMLQFAYSSKEVDEALLYRAQKDYQETGKFDFLSVGDTPFAMREWSRFLIMSGMKLEIGPEPEKKKTYLKDPENPWNISLGEDLMKDVRKKVYIAPRVYGNNWTRVNGVNTKVNAKIHHKIISTPNYAIVGTSFNFSEGAESNNEQLLVIRDKQIAKRVEGMVRYMVKNSPGTVEKEAQRRNLLRGNVDDDSDAPEDIQADPTPTDGVLPAAR